MPSPFPGMDPYLEHPAIWPDLHHGLISEIQAVLNRGIRPRYRATVEERVYVSDENDPGRRAIIPDVAIQSTNAQNRVSQTDPTVHHAKGALAVAEPITATTMIDEEIREARIAIVDVNDQCVVTVIEVVSPTNKIVGARGRTDYERKRREVLDSETHFVEIDLLRQGEPIYAAQRLPPHDYLVHVSRRGKRPRGTLWPILLTQRLPVIPIPLLPEDNDVDLDLKAVFDSAYDRAGYDLVVDYRRPPVVGLDEANALWAAEWLSNKGFPESVS